jgi:thioredoxin reductase
VDNDQQMMHIPGLYVAGDSSRNVLQVIVAAGEGAQEAIGINTALLREDLALQGCGLRTCPKCDCIARA